jgi:hypothetical protein
MFFLFHIIHFSPFIFKQEFRTNSVLRMASELLDFIQKEGAIVSSLEIHSFDGLRGLRATSEINEGGSLYIICRCLRN